MMTEPEKEGATRNRGLRTVLASIVVTPLQPPFRGPRREFQMAEGDVLALGQKDARALNDLMAKFKTHHIVLSNVDDKHVRISVVQ